MSAAASRVSWAPVGPAAADHREARRTRVRHRLVAGPETPLRERLDGGADTARRDWSALWAHLEPNVECGEPGRTGDHSLGSGSRDPERRARAVARSGSSVSADRYLLDGP